MYLLEGSRLALLIDTGDVTESAKAPLEQAVSALLRRARPAPMRLVVVHTHRHLDHRSGDSQFVGRRATVVTPFDLAGVKRFYGFSNWPHGVARLDLGGRVVDVLPSPGHSDTHVVFYDELTHILFSGDFLMPGRLLIDDASAERQSARTVERFIIQHPLRMVLGGHVEMNARGELFGWGTQDHPYERPLPLTRAQALFILSAAQRFNGVYGSAGPFVMENSILILALEGGALLFGLVALGWMFRKLPKLRRQGGLRWNLAHHVVTDGAVPARKPGE